MEERIERKKKNKIIADIRSLKVAQYVTSAPTTNSWLKLSFALRDITCPETGNLLQLFSNIKQPSKLDII